MVLEHENLNWNQSMAVRMLGRKNWLKRFKMEKRMNYPFKVSWDSEAYRKNQKLNEKEKKEEKKTTTGNFSVLCHSEILP